MKSLKLGSKALYDRNQEYMKQQLKAEKAKKHPDLKYVADLQDRIEEGSQRAKAVTTKHVGMTIPEYGTTTIKRLRKSPYILRDAKVPRKQAKFPQTVTAKVRGSKKFVDEVKGWVDVSNPKLTKATMARIADQLRVSVDGCPDVYEGIIEGSDVVTYHGPLVNKHISRDAIVALGEVPAVLSSWTVNGVPNCIGLELGTSQFEIADDRSGPGPLSAIKSVAKWHHASTQHGYLTTPYCVTDPGSAWRSAAELLEALAKEARRKQVECRSREFNHRDLKPVKVSMDGRYEIGDPLGPKEKPVEGKVVAIGKFLKIGDVVKPRTKGMDFAVAFDRFGFKEYRWKDMTDTVALVQHHTPAVKKAKPAKKVLVPDKHGQGVVEKIRPIITAAQRRAIAGAVRVSQALGKFGIPS